MSQLTKVRQTAFSTIRRTPRRLWRAYRFLGNFATCPVILIFLLGCMAAFIFQAYSALTRETVVAEVIMSPMATDENGATYIDIQFTPYDVQPAMYTALDSIFNRQRGEPQLEETQMYRVYGDTVAIRGPFMALQNFWRILGFDNVYKLALIEGEYRLRNSSGNEGSEYFINGGFEEFWWDRNDREADMPFSMIIKRITIAGGEEFGSTDGRLKRYEIVVTNDTITWNFIGYVE